MQTAVHPMHDHRERRSHAAENERKRDDRCECPLCALEKEQQHKRQTLSADNSYIRTKARETIFNRSGHAHHYFPGKYELPAAGTSAFRPYELLPKIGPSQTPSTGGTAATRDAWVLPSLGNYSLYDDLEQRELSRKEQKQAHGCHHSAPPREGVAVDKLPANSRAATETLTKQSLEGKEAFIVVDGKLKRLAIGPGVELLTGKRAHNNTKNSSPVTPENGRNKTSHERKIRGAHKKQHGVKDSSRKSKRRHRHRSVSSSTSTDSSTSSSQSSSSSSSSDSADSSLRHKKGKGGKRKPERKTEVRAKKAKDKHRRHRRSSSQSSSSSSISSESSSSVEDRKRAKEKRGKHRNASPKTKEKKVLNSRRSPSSTSSSPRGEEKSQRAAPPTRGSQTKNKNDVKSDRVPADKKSSSVLRPTPSASAPQGPSPYMPYYGPAYAPQPVPAPLRAAPPYPPYGGMPPALQPVQGPYVKYPVGIPAAYAQFTPPRQQQRQGPQAQQQKFPPAPPPRKYAPHPMEPAGGIINSSGISGASDRSTPRTTPPSLLSQNGRDHAAAGQRDDIPHLPYVVRDNMPFILEPADSFFSGKAGTRATVAAVDAQPGGKAQQPGGSAEISAHDLTVATQTFADNHKAAQVGGDGNPHDDEDTVVIEMGAIDELGHTAKKGTTSQSTNPSVDEVAERVLEALASRLESDDSLLRRSGNAKERSLPAKSEEPEVPVRRTMVEKSVGSSEPEPVLVAAEDMWAELRQLPDGITIEDVPPSMRHYFQERFPDTLEHTKKYLASTHPRSPFKSSEAEGHRGPIPATARQGAQTSSQEGTHTPRAATVTVACTADPDEIDRECQVAEEALWDRITSEVTALRRAQAVAEEQEQARQRQYLEEAAEILANEEAIERRLIAEEEEDDRYEVEEYFVEEDDELYRQAEEAAETERLRKLEAEEEEKARLRAAEAAEAQRRHEEAVVSLLEHEADSRDNLLLQEMTDWERTEGLERILSTELLRRQQEQEQAAAAANASRFADSAADGYGDGDSRASRSSSRRRNGSVLAFTMVRESRLIPNQMIGVTDEAAGMKVRLLGDPHVDAIEERIRERRRQDALRQQRLSQGGSSAGLRSNASNHSRAPSSRGPSNSKYSSRVAVPSSRNGSSKAQNTRSAAGATKAIPAASKMKKKRTSGSASPRAGSEARQPDGELDLGLMGKGLQARRRSSFAAQRGISGAGGGGVLYSAPGTPRSTAAASSVTSASDVGVLPPRRLSEMMEDYIQKVDVGYEN